MIIPVSLTNEDAERFRKFAQWHNQTVPEMIRSVVVEKIEEEQDWKEFKEALADHHISEKSFSLVQVKREGGIR